MTPSSLQLRYLLYKKNPHSYKAYKSIAILYAHFGKDESIIEKLVNTSLFKLIYGEIDG